MTRTDWQRFVRFFTPLRRYSCLDCKRRGWMVGSLPHASVSAADLGLPARPVEDRDIEEVADSRFRMVLGVGLAIGLGVLFALWLLRQAQQ
ncbi:MAG: hypothetical protein IPO09_18785 [Anaeromyxobacter sp.]|nr:hypothetical protein [Anaeromyxobacter sp.]